MMGFISAQTRLAMGALRNSSLGRFLAENAAQRAATEQAINDLTREITDFIENSATLNNTFTSSPNAATTASAQESLIKNIVSGGLGFGANTAMMLYAKNVLLDFSYIKSPTLRASADAIGGYYGIVINSLMEHERIKLQYKQIEISSIQQLLATQVPLLARVLSANRLTPFTSLIRNTLMGRLLPIVGRGLAFFIGQAVLSRALGSIRSRLAAAGVALLIPVVGKIVAAALVIAETYFFIQAIIKFNENQKNSERVKRLSQTKAAFELVKPDNVINIYRENVSLLLESGSLNYSELFDTNINSFARRVYDSSLFNLKNFGVETSEILSLGTSYSRQTPINFDQLDVLTSRTLDYSYILTGGRGTSDVSSIMSTIIKATRFTANDVTIALGHFNEFFSRVLGDSKPQAAYLAMMKSLAEFSLSYGAIGRLSDSPILEVSKIHQFMADENGLIQGRMDTGATESVIQTADDLIFKGMLGESPISNLIYGYSGITSEEAISGVTNDANVFVKFLKGVLMTMDLSREDVLNPNSNLYENRLRDLSFLGGFDAKQIQALDLALKNYAGGKEVDTILSEYTQSTSGWESQFLNYVNNFSHEENPVFKMLQNFTDSANKLTEVTNDNVGEMIKLQQAVREVILSDFNNYGVHFVDTMKKLFKGLGVYNASKAVVPSGVRAGTESSTGNTGGAGPSTGATGASGGAAGVSGGATGGGGHSTGGVGFSAGATGEVGPSAGATGGVGTSTDTNVAAAPSDSGLVRVVRLSSELSMTDRAVTPENTPTDATVAADPSSVSTDTTALDNDGLSAEINETREVAQNRQILSLAQSVTREDFERIQVDGIPLGKLIFRESSYIWDNRNRVLGFGGWRGHFGLLQFGVARLMDLSHASGIGTHIDGFMADPNNDIHSEIIYNQINTIFGTHRNSGLGNRDIQAHIIEEHVREHLRRIDGHENLVNLIGTTVSIEGMDDVLITRTGLFYVAHLSGFGGMRNFITKISKEDFDGGLSDAFGTSQLDYLRMGEKAEEEMSTWALGGFVNKKNKQYSMNVIKNKPKQNLKIKIPISSTSPHEFVKRFSDIMRSTLS